jgi:lipopolysaccharide transport system ATP-binding protein
MFPDVVISARQLCKTYRSYAHPLGRLLHILRPGGRDGAREFVALRNATIDIVRGECVGVIGRNGSGKSTLLQLICGIRHPSSGSIRVSGRISALLELGAGFHPEFTGRENVFLQGAIQGMSRDEMTARFDAIAAFADIGEFMDQPVRTYSSGMFIRLAFAVATSVRPDILVVDEALAVGDALFRSRCFRRIREIRDAGGTILFASHASEQIMAVCDRAILLDEGEMLAVGSPRQVLGQFKKLLYCPPAQRPEVRSQIRAGDAQTAIGPSQDMQMQGDLSGSGLVEGFDPGLQAANPIVYESAGAVISAPAITTCAGIRVNSLVRGNLYRFCYDVRFDRDAAEVRFAMLIKTALGIELGGAASSGSAGSGLLVNANTNVHVEFTFTCALNSGIYFLNAGVSGYADGEERILHRMVDAQVFKVATEPESLSTASVDFGCAAKIQFEQQPGHP